MLKKAPIQKLYSRFVYGQVHLVYPMTLDILIGKTLIISDNLIIGKGKIISNLLIRFH